MIRRLLSKFTSGGSGGSGGRNDRRRSNRGRRGTGAKIGAAAEKFFRRKR